MKDFANRPEFAKLDAAPTFPSPDIEQNVEVGRSVRIGLGLLGAAALSLYATNTPAVVFASDAATARRAVFLPFLDDVVGAGIAYWTIAIAASLAVVLAVLPALAVPLLLWCCVSTFGTSVVVEGGEQVQVVTLLLMLPYALGERGLRLRHPRYETVPAVSRGGSARLLSVLVVQVQASGLYAHSVLAKLGRTRWQDGTAVYYFGQDNVFGPPTWLQAPYRAWMRLSWGSPSLTWGALAIESFLAIAPWLTHLRARRVAMATVVGFHGLIAITIGLPSFALAMFGLNSIALNPFERAETRYAGA